MPFQCLNLGAFGVVLYFVLTDERLATTWFAQGSFAVMLALIAGWLAVLVAARRAPAQVRRSASRWPWAVAALVATALVGVALKPQIRVVSDETNLVLLGRNLALNHVPVSPTQGLVTEAGFEVLSTTEPDRPLLFPMLLALLNVVSGFRVENAFFLNLLALALLLYATGRAEASRTDWRGAGALVLLLIAQPLLPLTATSAGYDIVCVGLLALAAAELRAFLATDAPAHLGAAWATLIAAAHVRHETVLFLGVLPVGLLALGRLGRRHLWPLRWLLAATPWAILPRIMHILLYGHNLDAKHQVNRDNVAMFSWDHLAVNLKGAWTGISDLGLFYPYASVVCLAGLVAMLPVLAHCARSAWRRSPAGDEGAFLLLLIVGEAVHVGAMLMYWAGNALSPITARYFLPACLLLSVVVYRAFDLLPRARRFAPVFAVCALIWYFPVAWGQTFAHSEQAIRKVNFVYRSLEKEEKKDLLIVADFPGRYTAVGYGAVSFDYFRAHNDELVGRWRRGGLRDILVLQEFPIESGIIRPNEVLPPALKLVPVDGTALSQVTMARLSRLVREPPP